MTRQFPIDVNIRELRNDRSYLRGLVIAAWVGILPVLIPWRIRCAIWNWMWQKPKAEQINWRTHKRFGDEQPKSIPRLVADHFTYSMTNRVTGQVADLGTTPEVTREFCKKWDIGADWEKYWKFEAHLVEAK